MILFVVLVVLEVVLVVLGVVLVVLGVVLRQCSEQMFGTDSVRNNVPSQLSKSQRDSFLMVGIDKEYRDNLMECTPTSK